MVFLFTEAWWFRTCWIPCQPWYLQSFFDLTVSVLVLPAMANIEGVGDEWEDDVAVREHIRSTGIVTQRPVGMKWCEPNRPNCVANSLVLTPLLQRMHDEDGYKLPSLEDLKRQIAILYHRLRASPSEKVIYTTAVELKKLCSFVKRRTNRLEVTKDRMNQVDLNMLISYVTYNGFIFFGGRIPVYTVNARMQSFKLHRHHFQHPWRTPSSTRWSWPSTRMPRTYISYPKGFDKQIRHIFQRFYLKFVWHIGYVD